ncbi:MAG: ATP-binding protein [Tissierellaceae bacterium]|nr:ATP-binding protein [Tissierellaceae bacterium]
MDGIRHFYFGWNRYGAIKKLLIFTLLLIVSLFIGKKNFLLYHTFIELACITIAFMMVIVSVNTCDINKDKGIIFLSIAYGFISFLDFIHLLSYNSLAISVDNVDNISMQLWLGARLMEGLSFIYVLGFLNKKRNIKQFFFAYLLITAFLLISVFYFDIFPDLYIEESGTTFYKILGEYFVTGTFVLSILLISRQKFKGFNRTNTLLIYALTLTAISEILFANYLNFDNIVIVLGLLLKFVSYYLIYMALIQTSLKEPHYDLMRLNKLLDNKNKNLESLIIRIKEEFEKREKLEDDNTRKKEILDAILEASASGILVIGNDQSIIHVNKSFLRMWDISYDMVSSENIHDFLHDIKGRLNSGEEFNIFTDKLLGAQNSITYDIHLKNGRILEAIILPFIDKGVSKGKVLSFRDVTRRNQIMELEKQIEINRVLLEKTKELDEIKTNFFATISHELRTPINIILGVVQLMPYINISENNMDSEQYHKYINMVKQNCYRLIKLANNIIDISKIDAGYLKINLKNYNIVSIIEDITLSVVDFIENKGISIVFDTDEEEIIVACDADKMERVMLNLLSNSAKFVEPGGRIEVRIKKKNRKVLIIVKDTGTGIPTDMKDTIFNRFQQVDSSLRRPKEGSGIGLSIVKSMIELHNGNIKLNSDIGRGSEFIIELPINLVNENVSDHREIVPPELNVDKINIEFSDIYDLNNI